MGILYVDTGGNAANSGSSDNASADLTGTSATFISGTTVQLDSGTVLTGIVTSGATQSSINIAGATNTNRTVFWITAVSGSGGATPQVTLDVAPTGMTTNTWRIGGQYVFPGTNVQNVIVNALRAGDILEINNTPATKSTVAYIASAAAGDSTSGRITVRGKTGVRPVLQMTGNMNAIAVSGHANWSIHNLELTSSGTFALLTMTSGTHADNLKITGTGGSATQHGISVAGFGIVTNCEISGVGGSGISHTTNSTGVFAFGNYIHGCGIDGITSAVTGPLTQAINNTITGNTGRGIYISGASTTQVHQVAIIGNTIYGNTLAGIEILDADTVLAMRNNIVQATLTTVASVKWAAGNGQNVSTHAYNVFWNSADSNSGLSGVTADATDVVANPAMTNPGGGDFSISSSSSAAGAGYPGTLAIAGGTTGYRDIGAFQRQVGGSSAAKVIGG